MRRALRRLQGGRRLACLLGVIAAVAALALIPAAPAAAAPFGSCDDPPMPERGSLGLTGQINPNLGRGLEGAPYKDYGYSGMVWHTYDVGMAPLCSDWNADLQTWLGNQFFNAAKVIVAGSNALHYTIWEGGTTAAIDNIVREGALVSYKGIALPVISIALLLMGLVMLRFATAGDNANTTRASGRTIVALLIISTALTPLVYTKFVDELLFGGLKELQRSIGEQLYKGEDVVYRDVVPTQLHNTIVYDNWVRGEFGATDTPEAKKYARRLLDAQAFTWAEMSAGSDGKVAVIEEKNREFKRVAEAMKDNPAFKGESGRIPAGLRALFESLTMGLFTLVSNAAVLLAQLLLRAMVLFAPLLGLMCLLPGRAATIGRSTLGILTVGILITGVSMIYSFVMLKILAADSIGTAMQLLLMLALTVFTWKLAMPVRRMQQLLGSVRGTLGAEPHSGGMLGGAWRNRYQRRLLRAMRRNRPPETRWWAGGKKRKPGPSAVDTADDGDFDEPIPVGAVAERMVRPEAIVPPFVRRGGLPPTPSGAAGRGGGTPPGSAPGGAGTAATPRTARAEVVRNSGWAASSGTGGGALSAPSRPLELEAGPAAADPPPAGPRAEVVVPSEILGADPDVEQARPEPRRVEQDGIGGFVIFDPTAGRRVIRQPRPQITNRPDTGPDATPRRPEAKEE